MQWSGSWTPTATLTVPASGVLRVRDLGIIDGGNVQATLRGGTTHVGFFGVNAPAALGGGRMAGYCFAPWPGTEPDIAMADEATVVARIRELEGR